MVAAAAAAVAAAEDRGIVLQSAGARVSCLSTLIPSHSHPIPSSSSPLPSRFLPLQGAWTTFNRGFVWISIIVNLSQFWAMYNLIFWYKSLKEELAPLHPVGKIATVKLVVFVSFWQSMIISGLCFLGVINATFDCESLGAVVGGTGGAGRGSLLPFSLFFFPLMPSSPLTAPHLSPCLLPVFFSCAPLQTPRMR